MTRGRSLLMVFAALAAGVSAAPAQLRDAGARIAIEEPASDSFVTGATALRAEVTPTSAAVLRVDFFVDGVRVCQATTRPFQCSWDAGPAVVEHVVRAVAVLPTGDRVAATVRTKALPSVTETTGVDVVLVPFVATDARQRFVKGLQRTEVQVLEDDAPQPITYFEAEEAPLEVVVAVDISGSMTESMPQLKAALTRFLRGFKPTDRVTLVGFNHQVYVLGRRETDRAALVKAVDGLTAAGGTSLYDAILTSLDLLGPNVQRRAVMLFSDGDDQASLATPDAVERRIRGADAVTYFVTLGGADGRRVLGRFAELSGGRTFSIGRIGDLDETLGVIREELENQYLLGYAPVNAVRDGSYRRIRVAPSRPQVQVRSRQGYRADERR